VSVGKTPNFDIVRNDEGTALILRDVGPWDEYLSITNGAEQVVESIVKAGLLPEGRRLFYHDTDGELTELIVTDGVFAGFGPSMGAI
jgi:hypothetical protein